MDTTNSPAILIVGAGPIGLTLACELALRGVPSRLVDRALEPSRGSRATDIHARTLEIFDELGLGAEVVARGKRVTRFCSYERGRPVLDLSLEGLASAHPHAVALPQEQTEALLTRRLHDLGGSVERGVTVRGLELGAHGVTVQLAHADGRLEARGYRYVIGCDGVKSTLRSLAGISFDGVTLDQPYLVVDAELDWELAHDRVHLFTAPGGFINVLAMPGERNVRVMANVPKAARGSHVEIMRALMRERMGVEATLYEPSFSSTFGIAQRIASRYRRGRVFLAGDAAHTWSPLLGQGMNVGIQDAYNLGWKLALVVSGAASESLLDSYETERRPVAKMVMLNTHLMHELSTLSNPVAAIARDRCLRWIQPRAGFSRLAATMCSELATHYRASPIVGGDRSALRHSGNVQPLTLASARTVALPGDRAPNPPTGGGRLHERLGRGHSLLLFSGASSDDSVRRRIARIASAMIERHGDVDVIVVDGERASIDLPGVVTLRDDGGVHEAFSADAPLLCLVRPDRHIAFRSSLDDEDRLHNFCRRLFGRASSARLPRLVAADESLATTESPSAWVARVS